MWGRGGSWRLRNGFSGDEMRSGIGPMVTIGALFFIFGFVTWLNGPLITFVKLAFDLDDINAFLVPMAFYLSYFFLALPAASVLRRTGMKSGMAVGLLVMAVGAAAFGHFTTMRIYPGSLAGLFVIGAGLSLLQTASNPYVSIVGPIETAATRIAFMGICNKLAGVLAPILFGALVMHGIDGFDARVKAATDAPAREALLDAFAAKVYVPYMAMAGILALLAYAISRSNLPDVQAAPNSGADIPGAEPSLWSATHLLLGVVCMFLYVGVEVMAGDAIGVYGAGFDLPLSETRFFTSYTLFAMVLGYVAGLLLIPRVASQQQYLAFSGLLGIVLTVCAYATSGYPSVLLIASLGFANAMMWPAIFPLAINGLGRKTEIGSALLIMAIAGGAIMPYLFGLLKQRVDFQLAYALLAVPSYLFIWYYGAYGFQPRKAPAEVSPA